jgi:type VII secretion protein EccE
MTARITLALLFIVPAAMAYPWHSTANRWLLGVAVAAVIVLFASWRGLFLTTMVGRRLAMWRRRNHKEGVHQSSEYATVLLRVDPSEPVELPLPLIAGYLDRYGIRCDMVRVISRDTQGVRATWIALTLGAADNLAALRARSPRIPLHDTAEIAARRLAGHLRETGWSVTIMDTADAPARTSAKETWRGLRDESGDLAAYRVTVNDRLPDTLANVWTLPSPEIWTALEITGTATDPDIAVVCAVRFRDRPTARAPIAGLAPVHGRHRPALNALNPLSVDRLDAEPVPLADDLLHRLRWPVSPTSEPRPHSLSSTGPTRPADPG